MGLEILAGVLFMIVKPAAEAAIIYGTIAAGIAVPAAVAHKVRKDAKDFDQPDYGAGGPLR